MYVKIRIIRSAAMSITRLARATKYGVSRFHKYERITGTDV